MLLLIFPLVYFSDVWVQHGHRQNGQLLRKNYKGHIKDIHPGENFDDLKQSGQSTTNDMFDRQNNKKGWKVTVTV